MSGRDRYPGLHKRWPSRTVAARFFDHVSPEPNTGCHLWTGAVHRQTGYGVFAPEGTRVEQAHRFAFKLSRGRFPKPGFEACHSCDVRSCVNERHIFEGTRADNMKDASRKGRVVIGTAKLTIAQAEEIARRARAGEKGLDLAREFSVSPGTVSSLKTGARRPTIGRKEV
jgi:hypothetical protein